MLLALGKVVLSAASVKLNGRVVNELSATHCFTEIASSWTTATEMRLKNISEVFRVGLCFVDTVVHLEKPILEVMLYAACENDIIYSSSRPTKTDRRLRGQLFFG